MILKIFKKLGEFIYETIQTIVIFGSIFVFVYFFAIQPHQVIGESMEPSFFDQEYILTDKISYRLREPERGDVVVFKAPNNPRRDYIKRIIAVPGETVSINNNTVYVNNKPLTENYLDQNERIDNGNLFSNNASIIVPEHYYFVLGDNRDHSQDSRVWGPVDQDSIVGRVFFRYWPPQQFGKVEAITY